MSAGAAGRCYHALVLLGAGEVTLEFWALRWKEKGEHSHNLWLHSNCDHKHFRRMRCRKMRGMKLSAIGEGTECKLVLSPTAPSELNYAVPWLLMGQIKKNKKTIFIQGHFYIYAS